jgi:hypothetical protein
MTTLQTQLQPGDIVLLRRRSLSINAWVPGYWSHVALYVGSVGELKTLGLDHDPRDHEKGGHLAAACANAGAEGEEGLPRLRRKDCKADERIGQQVRGFGLFQGRFNPRRRKKPPRRAVLAPVLAAGA